MSKHTRLFYRIVARIRATKRINGIIFPTLIKKRLKITYIRALKLMGELQDTGVLSKLDWLNKKKRGDKGNILWENLSRFRVPKEVTVKENAKAEKDIKSGMFEKPFRW